VVLRCNAELPHRLLVLSSIATYTVSLTSTTENTQPTTPGERAITTLLRLVLYPPGTQPHAVGIAGPRLPSFLSGGAPRDRRGRLARKDASGDYDERSATGGPLGADTLGTVGGGGELGLRDDHEREGRELLYSLRSPNLELTPDNAEEGVARDSEEETDEGGMGTVTPGDAMETLGTGPGGWGASVGTGARPPTADQGGTGRRAAIYEDQVYEDSDSQHYANTTQPTASRQSSRGGMEGEREPQPAQVERKLRI
jgi:hypothetical protein